MPGKSKIVIRLRCLYFEYMRKRYKNQTTNERDFNSLIDGEQHILNTLISVEKGINNVI